MKVFSVILFVLTGLLVYFAIPKHTQSLSTINYGDGPLQLEGRQLNIPFMKKVRIGTWEARYDNGTIGEIIDYHGGEILFRSTYYYSGGQFNWRTQYREGIPYGTWTQYHRDGWVQYRKDHDDSGMPIQEVVYDKDGEIVFHILEGEIIVGEESLSDGQGQAHTNRRWQRREAARR